MRLPLPITSNVPNRVGTLTGEHDQLLYMGGWVGGWVVVVAKRVFWGVTSGISLGSQ